MISQEGKDYIDVTKMLQGTVEERKGRLAVKLKDVLPKSLFIKTCEVSTNIVITNSVEPSTSSQTASQHDLSQRHDIKLMMQ